MSQEALQNQISSHMHGAEAQIHSHSVQMPHPGELPHVGFVPFHPQQGHQTLHPEPPAAARHPEPSLSLTVGQPDAYVSLPLFPQQFQEQGPIHTSPPLRPSSVVRPFDLEQSLLQENPDYLTGNAPHSHGVDASKSYGSEAIDAHHNRTATETNYVPHADDPEAFQVPNHEIGHVESSTPSEKETLQMQLVPASSHDQSDGQQYPVPQAMHEAVIQDKELFLTTLDNLLAALGRRLMIPKVSGKDLDLHALYREVTARGGLEQVIRYTQWKELVDILGIELPLLSASFVLRKHYTNLLFHYEQVYFFRVEGQLKGFPVPLPAPTPVAPTEDVGSPYEAPPEIALTLKKKKRKLDPIQIFGVDPAAAVGTMVTGAINRKFEEGYLVTVVVGAEKLTGVLYHVSPANKAHQFASVPSLLEGVGGDLDAPGLKIKYYGKRKRNVRRAPRRTRTGYNIFFKEQRAYLKQLYPESKGLGKKVIEMWNKLPENEKALYIERGNQEREKFRIELLEHEEKAGEEQQSLTGDGIIEGDSDVPAEEHEQGSYDVSHDYHVSLDVEGDAQMPETDAYHVADAYHVNGPQSGLPDSEASRGHLAPEQVYDDEPEDDAKFGDEGESEEDGEEEAYVDEEEEGAYHGSEQGYDEQDTRDYSVVDSQAYNVQDGGYRPTPRSDDEAHEPETAHSGAVSLEHSFYGQGHAYTHPQGHKSPATGGLAATSEQGLYQHIIDKGEILHPHLQQSRMQMPGVFHPHLQQVHADAMNAGVAQQPYYPHDSYLYAQVRQGQTGEALGLPIGSDQSTYHHQEEGIPYPAHLPHQNHPMGTSVQSRQVPSSDQAANYQERYPYPIHVPYPQMYARPHAYPMRFPHIHPYPVHLADPQAMQFGHHPFITSHIHPPHASIPEVAGAAPSSQMYPVQDGGHAIYHTQEGQSPVYKHGSKGNP